MTAYGELDKRSRTATDGAPSDKVDNALAMSTGLERLRGPKGPAERDPDDPTRWIYFADETQSWWSITTDALIRAGKAEPWDYSAWAEAPENEAEERGRKPVRR